MPIDADTIRQLAGRGESATLDFKESDYDWSRSNINAELSKDIMAIANVIHRAGAPGYILVGVRNDGVIVGIQSSHQDDAALHQRVHSLLNRTPNFTYGAVDVEGVSVGVYQIRGGARPYYPLRGTPPLQKNVAVHRNGSSTEVASPDMILDWAREDDPDAYRLRSLQLKQAEADARIIARLRSTSRMNIQSGDALISLEIENQGRCSFWIERATCTFEWNAGFHAALRADGRAGLPEGYIPFVDEVESHPVNEHVPPSTTLKFNYRVAKQAAIRHFIDSRIGTVGWNSTWANYRFDVVCRSDLGGSEILQLRV
jgi:Putative DNA-binding domain